MNWLYLASSNEMHIKIIWQKIIINNSMKDLNIEKIFNLNPILNRCDIFNKKILI